jgi:signal transduction histidine kinase
MMRQRPWVVLVGGFGGLLLLMAAAEAGALYFLGSLRHNSASLEDRFLSRNRQLEQIRSNIYLSGTIARDTLLAPEPEGARAEIAALGSLRRDTQAALEHYAESLEPQEEPPFRSLQSQIEAYWKVLNGAFLWTPEERNKFRYRFFYEELVPRRTSMLQISDRIEALDEQALKRGHGKLDALFGRLQFGLVAIIAVTLLGGAALAASTIFYILRLEREAQRRMEESVQAQASLQELSARLVRAQEDERRALSRELHDEVGQSFSAILMEAENLLDLNAGEALRPRAESIRNLAEKGMNEIRDMALLLRPSMLDDFGLIPALNWQAREVSKRTGLRVQVSDEAPEELPEEHKTCIYRVVQEALNNCARHAQATTVQIAVRAASGGIQLSVQDDGSGFEAQRARGLGLRGMEERVRHLGGKFEIDSRRGRGTLLKIDLPLVTLNGHNGNGKHSHPAG